MTSTLKGLDFGHTIVHFFGHSISAAYDGSGAGSAYLFRCGGSKTVVGRVSLGSCGGSAIISIYRVIGGCSVCLWGRSIHRALVAVTGSRESGGRAVEGKRHYGVVCRSRVASFITSRSLT